jgi:hypothetical protein
MRHLPGVALQHHTIGECVAGQAKKGRQYRCNDAGEFAHRSASFDKIPIPIDHVSGRTIKPPGTG